jgi:hypothetical protein
MKMTMTTRPMVSSRVNSTSTTESRIDCERSDIRSTGPIRHRGEQARHHRLMLSTTFDGVKPGWRKISSAAALAVEPWAVRDLVASTTLATSCT